MSLPTMTGIGRLTADPDLRFSPSGVAVCNVRLAFSSRKKDAAGEWVDGDVCFMSGTLFRDEAERVAESLTKGTEVLVTGRVRTRKYTDKQDVERSVTEMTIDSIGPTMRWANVKVTKMTRKSEESGGGFEDPWAKSTGGGFDEEPPF